MTSRDGIREAVERLQLTSQEFVEVSADPARRLFRSFLERFTGGADVRWWWEHFSPPPETWCPSNGRGFERLVEIVPDPDEVLWFVAEDDQTEFFPVYETTARIAQRVIGECYAFEYYLIPKGLDWLLCENHHDVVFAVGDVLRERLAAIAR